MILCNRFLLLVFLWESCEEDRRCFRWRHDGRIFCARKIVSPNTAGALIRNLFTTRSYVFLPHPTFARVILYIRRQESKQSLPIQFHLTAASSPKLAAWKITSKCNGCRVDRTLRASQWVFKSLSTLLTWWRRRLDDGAKDFFRLIDD